MTLNDIPAGKTMTLTKELDRLFRFARCEPTCHACLRKIAVGDKFKLVSVKRFSLESDEMLCDSCKVTDLRRRWKEDQKRPAYAGYSRPSIKTCGAQVSVPLKAEYSNAGISRALSEGLPNG